MKTAIKVAVILVLGTAVAVMTGVLWIERALAPVSPVELPLQLFKVTPGIPFRSNLQTLGDRHLLRQPIVVGFYAKANGLDRSIQAGYYWLSPHMSAREILHKLVTGDRAHFRLTVPEGRAIRQIAALLDQYDGQAPVSYRQLAAQATPELRQRYPFLPAGLSLEGYLFPDTYELIERFGQGLLMAQLHRFAQVILPQWEKRPVAWPLNLHQTLTLASIVELEAVRPEERPLIAGIFLRRLQLNMPLGADPTVEYALQRHQDERGLSFRDIQVDSPYNTYRYKGLPPTPICNPGAASFRAVLQARPSPFLFFVARGDGSHTFSRTGAEHLQAIRQLTRLPAGGAHS